MLVLLLNKNVVESRPEPSWFLGLMFNPAKAPVKISTCWSLWSAFIAAIRPGWQWQETADFDDRFSFSPCVRWWGFFSVVLFLQFWLTCVLSPSVPLNQFRSLNKIDIVVPRRRTVQSGVRISVGTGGFSLLQKFETGYGAHQPPVKWGSFPGIQWPGLECDHSCSFSAEVKKEWSSTSFPPTRVYEVDRNNIT